jgi:catechol 2,3-dioxygenase-like lactoylglutathione lyase family enzyme
MGMSLNHTIVVARDKEKPATFFTEMRGLPPHTRVGHFDFLVDEGEFDEILQRIRDRQLPYWADPFRRELKRINTYDDGRGLYFDDPNGHVLEIITRPYGSGGRGARNPNPLLSW